LAADQLKELREQSSQFAGFTTDLALMLSDRVTLTFSDKTISELSAHIGERFQQSISPVESGLTELNRGIADMGRNVQDGLKGGVADAITGAAGAELRNLAAQLADLKDQLASLGSVVGTSGDTAAEKIRAAADQFEQAAVDIRKAFEAVAGHVDGLGQTIAGQSQAAARTIEDVIAQALTGLAASQAKTAEQIEGVVERLESAGASAASAVRQHIGSAIVTGFAEGQAEFTHALTDRARELSEPLQALAEAMTVAVARVESAASAFSRSGVSAEAVARQMDEVARETQKSSNALSGASGEFFKAAQPVAQAATTVGTAADRLSSAMERSATAQDHALRSMRELAEGTALVQSKAATAWEAYRDRFEGVDRELGKALETLRTNIEAVLEAQIDQAGKFDTKLGDAVGRLAGQLNTVEDLAEHIGEVADAMNAAAKAMERVAGAAGPSLQAAE
jgi:DNA repair exonuclease SbcCD ATPase subunit